ncbi:PREDICTED: uncharacterized protein LOC105121675 [Populus euphratica]|uniref:Uncharacterized protein LOC105121675 n=1 Tax=Populus euphratica TaxID=75702 RepID=A0AAJ6TWM3_POPEU|nr:PREDICTED: uncharacterized protein LOC105121675 [Populus euphratica]
MASIPDFFSDYQFPPDDFSEVTSIMADEDQSYVRTDSFSSTYMSSCAISNFSCAVLGDHQDHGNFPVMSDHRNGDAFDIFLGESEIMSPIPVTNSLPQPSGILDIDVLPQLMDYKMGGHRADIAKIQNFDAGFRWPEGYAKFYAPLPSFRRKMGMQEVEYDQTASTKNSDTKNVARYTAEERKERILKYLKKKNRRTYNNNVKYACRKTIAEGRPRVRGRFAKPDEVFEEETEVKTNDIILHKHQEEGKHSDGEAMRALLATIFEEEC